MEALCCQSIGGGRQLGARPWCTSAFPEESAPPTAESPRAPRRPALLLLLCALALGLAPAAASADPPAAEDGFARIRTLDPHIAGLFQEGVEHSPTMRRLADAVEASDLIVYIERHNRFRNTEAGEFRLAGAAGGHRYVRIVISTTLNDRELVIVLAHELQHATELAAATDVVSQRDMKAFYRRIGDRQPFGFDTPAARAVTERVSEELALSADR